MAQLGVNLSGVQADCIKPACTRPWVHRHHGGNQLMIIKWLRRYHPEFVAAILKLEEQYKKFDEKECCKVCEEHHAEGHALLDTVVRWFIKEHGPPEAWKKLSTFMKLQKECQRQTTLWLKKKTPGLKNGFHSLNAMKRNRKLRLGRR